MNSIQISVAEKIATLGPGVADKVINTIVEKELIRRSNALVDCIDKLEKEEKAFRKLGADQKTFDEKGSVVSEYYSKARVEDRAKTKKKIEKITAAITKALEKNEFSDVYNYASGKEPTDDNIVKGEDTEAA